MELTPHVEALREDVAALIGADPGAVQALERLDRALEASIQLRLLDALAQAAQELTDSVPGGHVEVRVAGRDAAFVFTPEPGMPAAAAEDDEAGMARLTVRLPESLKSRVEEAAVREGSSVNAWIVRAISERSPTPPTSVRTDRRITGFAQG